MRNNKYVSSSPYLLLQPGQPMFETIFEFGRKLKGKNKTFIYNKCFILLSAPYSSGSKQSCTCIIITIFDQGLPHCKKKTGFVVLDYQNMQADFTLKNDLKYSDKFMLLNAY